MRPPPDWASKPQSSMIHRNKAKRDKSRLLALDGRSHPAGPRTIPRRRAAGRGTAGAKRNASGPVRRECGAQRLDREHLGKAIEAGGRHRLRCIADGNAPCFFSRRLLRCLARRPPRKTRALYASATISRHCAPMSPWPRRNRPPMQRRIQTKADVEQPTCFAQSVENDPEQAYGRARLTHRAAIPPIASIHPRPGLRAKIERQYAA
jgi:hypothetical protein